MEGRRILSQVVQQETVAGGIALLMRYVLEELDNIQRKIEQADLQAEKVAPEFDLMELISEAKALVCELKDFLSENAVEITAAIVENTSVSVNTDRMPNEDEDVIRDHDLDRIILGVDVEPQVFMSEGDDDDDRDDEVEWDSRRVDRF